MPNFPDLPRELRDLIYQFCLVHKKPVDTCRYLQYTRPPIYGLAPNILRVSKAVHREASPVLYSQNIFDLSKRSCDTVSRFLYRIGSNNADQIRHIKIAFPHVCGGPHVQFRLDQGFVDVLRITQGLCHRAHTVTISHWYLSSLVITSSLLPSDRTREVATAAMTWIDSQLRSLPSLRQIVVQPGDWLNPDDHIRQEMARLGWQTTWMASRAAQDALLWTG
ncbi:hypothetical protein PG985_010510 [Apiospora marii]|uniref:Uncharacterized protein n=1 Tax=Apiospora marii TaxID=335849 RepID=A0ABR1T156_9PEZI